MRLLRPAILALVAALHAALLLSVSRWQTHLHLRSEESLVFLSLPAHRESAAETSQPPTEPLKKPAPAHEPRLVVVPTPEEPPPLEPQAPIIDWNAEVTRTAKQQAQSAAAPPPRALDQHSAGVDLDGGLGGSDEAAKPEFGWDHSHIHRVEALEGGGSILWINDRCFIVMAGSIPFPMCNFGKTSVRGDLFDHMHDLQTLEPNANYTAP